MTPPVVPILTIQKLPLLLHVIVETAAALTFIFKPSRQVPASLMVSANSDRIIPAHSDETTCSSSQQTQSSSNYDSHLSRPIISSSPSPPPSDGITTPTTTGEDAYDRKKAKLEHDQAQAIQELNLILLSYGGLLLTSNFTCLVFLARPMFDDLAGSVSLCMASYHVWPVWRALMRMRLYGDAGGGGDTTGAGKGYQGQGRGTGNRKFLGGPALHLVLHLGLLGGLVWAGLSV